jgi:hypothetical protein
VLITAKSKEATMSTQTVDSKFFRCVKAGVACAVAVGVLLITAMAHGEANWLTQANAAPTQDTPRAN